MSYKPYGFTVRKTISDHLLKCHAPEEFLRVVAERDEACAYVDKLEAKHQRARLALAVVDTLKGNCPEQHFLDEVHEILMDE